MVAPVAQAIPPARSGSVESVTSLLTDGLVAKGHSVTLFATGDSRSSASLVSTFRRGYHEDADLWPWELCELINLQTAVERADRFDVIHYQAQYAPLSLALARVSAVPLVVTVHHAPSPAEVALWSRVKRAPFIAISHFQRQLLADVYVCATIHHAVDTEKLRPAGDPEDFLLFLGRFTEGKGVLEAIDVARRAGIRLVLAAAENEYYREVVAPHVDGTHVVYAGEAGAVEKVSLLARARALLHPVQVGEPFGLVVAEAMACGTPVAALRRGAVEELVDEGVTGGIFDSLDEMVAGLPRVLALDRARVRTRALERFAVERMVDEHEALYRELAPDAGRRAPAREVSLPFAHGQLLLAIFAHPDDESIAAGGLLARAADVGAEVLLLCLTCGEAGRGGELFEPLAGWRNKELERAAKVLGIERTYLGFLPDGMLPHVDPAKVDREIQIMIEGERPDVVVTFDEDGLYWHPDHITVHERVTAVIERMGADAPALFYVSMQRGAMWPLYDQARNHAVEEMDPPFGVADPNAWGAMAPPRTHEFDGTFDHERKGAAIWCHTSQIRGTGLERMHPRHIGLLLAKESYRRAPVGSQAETFVDRILTAVGPRARGAS
jgi:LmbE family N-acetylglucosaminyl deacetylase/glycosyltransferase involved in cell wall biosynthesis